MIYLYPPGWTDFFSILLDGHHQVIAAATVIVGVPLKLGWKLLSCSHSQEYGQRPYLAPDWLHLSWQPIRSHISLLTRLLTLTKTQEFPPLVGCGNVSLPHVLITPCILQEYDYYTHWI